MHIQESVNRPHIGIESIARSVDPVTRPDAAGQANDSGTQRAGDTSHTPSPLVVGLTSQVQQIPEVRPDVVEAVTQRVSNGEYFTRAAAEATASAILES